VGNRELESTIMFQQYLEFNGAIPVQNPHPWEDFITSYFQVIRAECVDGPATVLTCEHYKKYTPYFSPSSEDKIHLCFW